MSFQYAAIVVYTLITVTSFITLTIDPCHCFVHPNSNSDGSNGNGQKTGSGKDDISEDNNPYLDGGGGDNVQNSWSKTTPPPKQHESITTGTQIKNDDDDDEDTNVPKSKNKFTDEFSGHKIVNGDNGQGQEDIDKAIKCSNNFAGTFYYILSEIYPNFTFSPVTISVMMALLLRGSDGLTLKEIYSSMNYNLTGFNNLKQVQNGFHGLSHLYQTNTDADQKEASGTLVQVSNSMWIDDGKKINSKFIDDAGNYFHTKLFPIASTINNGNKIRSMILKYADERTESKSMSCSIKLGTVDDNPQIIFINSLFFKGIFDSTELRNAPSVYGDFFANGQNKIATTYLKAKIELSYQNSEQYHSELIQIPFQSKESAKYSLIMILPQNGFSLKSIEEKINSLDNLLSEFKSKSMKKSLTVMMPKLSGQKSLKMDKLLSILGIKTLFDADKTELTQISAYERLSVSSIFHEASFDILSNQFDDDEDSPDIDIELVDSVVQDSQQDTFVLNRPFIYMIVDDTVGSIVIIGRVNSL